MNNIVKIAKYIKAVKVNDEYKRIEITKNNIKGQFIENILNNYTNMDEAITNIKKRLRSIEREYTSGKNTITIEGFNNSKYGESTNRVQYLLIGRNY